MLPAALGGLADALKQARDAIRARWPDAGERRRAISAALAGSLDPFADQPADAVDRWLAAPDAKTAGIICIALRSPDPDDLTLREARLLAQADRVTHRPDVPAAILTRARADAERIACEAPPANLPGLTVDLEMTL
jgi:uroporphyrin-III C-methyltransferase/precorrin-2 dehydrogenase/sirohydrochlorin ferrochelatase